MGPTDRSSPTRFIASWARQPRPWCDAGPEAAWLVAMAVPFDRPGTIAALLRITHRVFASTGGVGDKSLEIVLTPNAPALDAHAGPARPAGNRSAAPLVPALR